MAVEANEATAVTLRFDTPGVWARSVVGGDGRQYTQLSIPGCGATADAFGHPELPFKGFFLEFPAGTQPVVELHELTLVDLGSGYTVYPLQLPPPDESGHYQPPFVKDDGAYAQGAFLPACPVRLDETGIMRGRHVVFVQVFPVQYNQAAGALRSWIAEA